MYNFSITGYKRNSPDVNRSHNIIPGNVITMQGVDKRLTLIPIVNGVPQYDRSRVANPGDPDIQFESDVEGVLELPNAQFGMGPQMINPVLFQQYMPNNAANQMNTALDYSIGTSGNTLMDNVTRRTVYENTNSANYTNDPNRVQYFTDPSRLPYNGDPSIEDPNYAQINEQRQRGEQQKAKPFQGAINPYGSWNLQNTSTALGAFIQDKNPLGIIAAAGKLALEGTRNAMAGAAAYKTYQEAQEERERELEEEQRRQGLSFQKGGEVGKLLTGNYITGNDEHPSPSAEVEKGEFIQTPDGVTTEVIGDKHSDGGELVDVPDGTKVVSDYLKIGSNLATYFKKEFDINTKSSNTFATVLDKYRTKIGLTKLIDEEEKLMNKLNDQTDVEFEGTKQINLQVLSEKINELQPQKQELENMFEVFTNVVYEAQEESKQPGGKNFKKQEGGEVVDDQGQPIPQEQNQLEQLILMFAQLTGQNPQEIIQQLTQLPEEQLQGAIDQMMAAVQQASQQQGQPTQEYPNAAPMMKEGGPVSRAQFERMLGNYSSQPGYRFGDVSSQKAPLKEMLDSLGIPYTEEELNSQSGQNRLAGLAQRRLMETDSNLAEHFSSTISPTQKGLQTALDSGLVTEKELKDLGVKINKGIVERGATGVVPKGNEKKLSSLITEKGGKNEEGYKKYLTSNFVDDQWYYRRPQVQQVSFKNQEELDKFTGQYTTTIDSNGRKVYYSGKEGLYFTPVIDGKVATPTTAEEKPPVDNPDAQEGINPWKVPNTNYGVQLPMLTPDQSNIPPNLMLPGLRTVNTLQSNTIRVSPERTITELNRQYATASNIASQTNPYTSGAMSANLFGQTADAINQAYSQASLANAADERNVANMNEQRIQEADRFNVGASNAYEQVAQTAAQNYYNEWRSFIDKRNLEGVNNFNLQNQMNAFNAVNQNYKIGPFGQIIQTDEPFTIYYNAQGQPVSVIDNKTKKPVELADKKSEKKKKGGLLLKNGKFLK